MRFNNRYSGKATFGGNGNIFGKGLELLKSKIFNNKEENGSIELNTQSSIEWEGEIALDISVEEMVELHKEYGDDFERTIKYLKEELRPITKEVMAAIDDAAKATLKTINDCEDLERIHDEKVKTEFEAKEEKKSE